jgi:hypothetical protein
MATNDGTLMVPVLNGSYSKQTCSRWEELAASLKWQASVSIELGVRTEFRCLNPPRGARQTVVVDGMTDDDQS